MNIELENSNDLRMRAEEFNELLDDRLPFAQIMGIKADYFRQDHVRLRAVYNDRFLRPGGTVSGPVMMGLADAALYALVLSRLGPVELAVTTNLSINFLRKPQPADLVAEARLLKLGKRLAIGEVTLYSDMTDIDGHDSSEPVAHVTGTYSIPPS